MAYRVYRYRYLRDEHTVSMVIIGSVARREALVSCLFFIIYIQIRMAEPSGGASGRQEKKEN